MSARHSSPPLHNPTSTLDSELSNINSGYVDIPCEIWIEIAELVDGIDVLSLSSTSKTIHSFLSSRAFWTQYLQSVCRKYGVFPPTFPVDTMSTCQIKNAALRPSRWGGEHFPSTVTRWPYYRRPWGPLLPPDGTRCSQLVGLVPGGRFLVTRSRDIATITLWDLGLPGSGADSPCPPRMIAEYYTADGHVRDPSEATMCAASEEILRVLVVLCTGVTSYLAKVLHIEPSSDNPAFVDVASLRIANQRSDIRPPLIRGNHVVLSSNQSVLLWEYTKGRVACWTVPRLSRAQLTPNMCLPHERLLVCSTPDGLVAWSLPRPKCDTLSISGPIPVCDPPGSIPLLPDFTHTYPWSPGTHTSHTPSFLVNLCPTRANPIGFNITLPGNMVVRYHLVLNIPTSVGDLEPSNTPALFHLQPISICSISAHASTTKMGDCFGHGVLRIPEWLPTVMAVSLDVYRAHPYKGDDDPWRNAMEDPFKPQTESMVYPADTLSLKRPRGTTHPLAGCTLSGRVLYGDRRFGGDASDGSIVLMACADYLP